jgi:hypothetical protein
MMAAPGIHSQNDGSLAIQATSQSAGQTPGQAAIKLKSSRTQADGCVSTTFL